AAIDKLCAEVAALRGRRHRVVVVTSGATAAGLPALGLSGARPADLATLQAISAVGQSHLMRVYDDALARHGLLGGQVLLAPLDFVHRAQYLHARGTLTRLLDLGVVPVVNENDAAAADRPGVLVAAVDGESGAGTVVRPHDRKLSARKLWIGFAVASSGTVVVDDGARRALVERSTSLLPAGVVEVQGDFDADDAVELADPSGKVFAKGLVRYAANVLKGVAGSKTSELAEGLPHEVIHRDDLVVLP